MMKNLLKIGFLALAIGVFATACGGGASEANTDSTATAATESIDSAKLAAESQIAATTDSAKSAVDSVSKAATDTVKH
jgi:hypothetical protein